MNKNNRRQKGFAITSEPRNWKRGFTLIELLIVIVVIGILAGITVAVINPTAQQNKARDGNIKSALNKLNMEVKSYIASFGIIPDEAGFFGMLSSNAAQYWGNDCTGTTSADCRLSVTGIQLPATCSSTYWNGTGSSQCYFRYRGLGTDPNYTSFRLYAKSSADTNMMYVYEYVVAGSTDGFYLCASSAGDSTSMSTCTRIQ